MNLGEGLDEIGVEAFYRCTSLQSIVISPNVKAIYDYTFAECSGLTTVTFNDGMKEIGKRAFYKCKSLECIMIPRAVNSIHQKAFDGCSSLTNVEFCAEIEQFVSWEAIQDWWNHGVHERSLSTYCFLVKCNIPERLGLVTVRSWQANIYEMLNRIPSIPLKSMKSYFVSIDSRLTMYERLKESPALLEPAI